MRMRSSTVTTLAADAYIQGDLRIPGNLVLHGRIEGHGAVGGILTVGPRGVWDGDVEATFLYVDGLVTGSVVASAQIVVGRRGRIQGWVRTPQLKILEGGRVDGELFVGKAQVHHLSRAGRRVRPAPAAQAVGQAYVARRA